MRPSYYNTQNTYSSLVQKGAHVEYLPHLTHLIQLIVSLVENAKLIPRRISVTWMQKAVRCFGNALLKPLLYNAL